MISSWPSRCTRCHLSLAVLVLFRYAQDIWSRRREIFDACRDSSNYYESLKQHAFLHGLAATQVLPPGALLRLVVVDRCCRQVLRFAEVLGLQGFEG